MFGWKAILPVNFESGSKHANAEEITVNGRDQGVIQRIQETTKKKLEEAKANITSAQKKQEELLNRKYHHPDVYAVGALVLKKDFAQKKKERRKAGFPNGSALTKSQGHSERFIILSSRRC